MILTEHKFYVELEIIMIFKYHKPRGIKVKEETQI